jgi:Tfp pilus assembly protein PilF
MEIWTTIPGKSTNLEYAKLVNNYGMLKYKQGMYTDCEKLLVQANQIAIPVVGSEHPDVIKFTNNLKSCREKLKSAPK